MAARKRKVPARSTRKPVSYKDSDTEKSDNSDASSQNFASPEPVKKRATTAKKTRTIQRLRVNDHVSDAQTSKSSKTRRVQLQAVIPSQLESTIPSDGILPDWSSLPYEILLIIFKYASNPLRDDAFNATPQTTWLLKTAHVCKAFCEPALSAFYECPPLLDPLYPHGLLLLLKQDPETLAINYHAKIRKLEFDVRSTLAYSAPGKGHISMADILDQVPNLSSINITDEKDEVPFQYRRLRPKWFYPPSLFQNLMGGPIRLKSWRINGNFIHPTDTRLNRPSTQERQPETDASHANDEHDDMATSMYSSLLWASSLYTPVFNDLRSLALSNLNLDGKHKSLINAIAQLSNLREMKIISCQDTDWKIFTDMPQLLRSLDVQDCNFITSTIVQSYLANHGRSLHTLVLSHNKALDLAFLPTLKFDCPALRVLHMDFTYYSQLYVSKNFDPTFERLLNASDRPTWPSTLEHIELNHLRKWSSDAAETLFGSLIESAESLTYLRTLRLKAAIDIGWRDRAGFRETWISRFRSTFLRLSEPPSLRFASARAFRESKKENMTDHKTAEAAPEATLPLKSPTRHQEKLSRQPDSALDTLEQSDSTSRRSCRIKQIATEARRVSQEQLVASAEESEEDVQIIARMDWKKAASEHYQGLCSVVDITIDNMRPSEVQFEERDFMDTERSGDEDWTGEMDEDVQSTGGRRHAW